MITTSNTDRKTLVLIDANSLIHRCFHAIPPLHAPDGQPTNALYGVANTIYKIFQQIHPQYAAAAFDRPEKTFRKQEYELYKAHRPKAPDALISQLQEARNLFTAFGIKTFEQAGFEADDIIGTLAEIYKREKNIRIIIMTGDLDALQLIDGDTVVVETFKKGISETMVYTEQEVQNRYGISSDKLIDYKALVGDVSDNIPGVAGIGPKTAVRLLEKYGSLDSIMTNGSNDKKYGDKIVAYKDQIRLAKRLATIKTDVEIASTLQELVIAPLHNDTQQAYCRKMGFETLLSRMKKGEEKKEKIKDVVKEGRQKNSLFSDEPKYSIDREIPEGIIITTQNNVSPLLGDDTKRKIGFDLKNIIKKSAQRIAGPYADLGVACWLLNPDRKAITPEQCVKEVLNESWMGNSRQYSLLYNELVKKLEQQKLLHIFESIEMKILPILADMELCGIGVSGSTLEDLALKIQKQIDGLEKEIYKSAGVQFNINSPQQLSAILFDRLNIENRSTKKNKQGNFSTDAEHLEDIRDKHPIVQFLLKYRELFKIQTTYVRALSSLIADDGRIHTQYIQTGTGTGRLSSKDPNLQNIPQESEWSKQLRSAFVAQEGYSFIALDYSQLELRLLAAVSGDEKMTEAFLRGDDIHKKTAQAVLGVAEEEITKEDRRLAKTLNFGLIYGMGISAFAKATGISRAQSQEFVKKYFNQFPTIKQWQESVRRDAHQRGYVQTVTGRRRYFPGIQSGIPQVVAAAERAAINFPLQGLGADILKMAMIRSDEMIRAHGWGKEMVRLLLSIHDELLFEVRDDMIQQVSSEAKKVFESVMPDLPIPLRVEVSMGKDWGTMKNITP
ncbi:MAG: hypothetical protein RIQ54_190 [Candidatus Parcubacteria bacterium]